MNDVLAVISAGGLSLRYGSPKALAQVGGRRVVDRAADALRAALPGAAVVAIVNDAALADAIGLPHRPDVLERAGAVAGVHAAVTWAAERGCSGAFVLGCDMPFVHPALMADIVGRAAGSDVVAPESNGPRGIEPLCAWYSVACRTAIESAVARGDRRVIGFHDDVRVLRVPLADVTRHGDPARLFLNLNTPDDRDTAERLLQERT